MTTTVQQITTEEQVQAPAGQSVFHFHIHVIPRYKADPLRLPWQPAPGDRDEIAAAARALSA